MKKQPDVTDTTRKNLMEAFWQLYCRKRIERISVKEIAALAGYNRGTFYEYFRDTRDVLERIEDSLLPDPDGFPPLSSDASLQPVDGFVRIYQANSRYYTVLLGDKGDPAFQGRMKARIKPMLLEALADRTSLDAQELDYALEYLLSAMIGVLGHWFRQDDPPPVEKLVRLMTSLSREGVVRVLSEGGGKTDTSG